ncbi:DUF1310 family protein [Streptococcus acidominimus]|uniref:Membrane protein n=1 Tax=Streptococcus acidominimus TaxID=1326 RepID=A0A1Q8E5S8_STRAI|nr:DUF1310 family protein [Streptococcus acidominimus]OLF47145.1 hypothetical protein BU200_10320 [Streptococcus acidominimus]SUN08129.1 membrane protein [Streptococcus acidominimus]
MKNWQKWILGFIFSVAVIIGIGVLEQMNKQEQLKQEMIKVVESEEVRKIFEDELKYIEPEALTDKAIIKSYAINYNSFNKNPMGGFSTALIINGNEKLYIRIGIDKDKSTNKLIVYSSTISNELQALLEEKLDD